MYTINVTPRFGEVDMLGHITNTVPALWFELARNALFKIFAPDKVITLDTWPLIMAHSDYDFVAELRFDSDVEIRSGISRIGNKSFTMHHEAWQGGKLCVKGDAVIVYFDFKTKQSQPIPKDKKELLTELLWDK